MSVIALHLFFSASRKVLGGGHGGCFQSSVTRKFVKNISVRGCVTMKTLLNIQFIKLMG